MVSKWTGQMREPRCPFGRTEAGEADPKPEPLALQIRKEPQRGKKMGDFWEIGIVVMCTPASNDCGLLNHFAQT